MLRHLNTAVLAALALGACSDDPPRPACPRQRPAFRLQVSTEAGGPLPADTALVVRYQGSQQESYVLASPPASNEDVCCRPGEIIESGALPSVSCNEPPGDAGTAATALHCVLWTNGVAAVGVTAKGYAVLEETLEAEMREDECGLQTLDVRLLLTRGDGGTPE